MKLWAITAIVLVAVVMGMSAVVSSIQAFSVPTQILPEQIAKDNGIDLDQPRVCQKDCAQTFREDVKKCQGDVECVRGAVQALQRCIDECFLGD